MRMLDEFIAGSVADALGRVSQTERYSGTKASITVSASGDLGTSSVGPGGPGTLISSTSTIYNAAGQAAETVDASGLRTGTIYSVDGQVQYTGPIQAGVSDTGAAAWYNNIPSPDGNRRHRGQTHTIDICRRRHRVKRRHRGQTDAIGGRHRGQTHTIDICRVIAARRRAFPLHLMGRILLAHAWGIERWAVFRRCSGTFGRLLEAFAGSTIDPGCPNPGKTSTFSESARQE